MAATLAYFLSRASQVTGSILSAGGGRLARVVFAENAGVLGATDAEAVRAHLTEALDVAQVRVLESSFEELGLYTTAFPFDGQGAGPALDRDAVVGAGRERE